MADIKIRVDRPAMDLKHFDLSYGHAEEDESLLTQIKDNYAQASCAKAVRYTAKSIYGLVPLVETLRTYEWRKWILTDLITGISVGMIHIPQGMAFALIASLPPVYGLYSSFWPVMIYMLLGHCRHLSIGTMAVISVMIGPVVERETTLWKSQSNSTAEALFAVNATQGLVNENSFRISVASGFSLLIGLTMLAMSILRLGVIATFMPPSFISGYTTAAAFHIINTQLKNVFNVKVDSEPGILSLPKGVIAVCRSLPQTNFADFLCSLICFSFLVFIKEFINLRFKKKLKTPIPAEMIVVILGTSVSYLADLNGRWSVRIVGDVPVGIAGPAKPNLDHVDNFIVEALVGGITSFAISISMAQILSGKHKYLIDINKELFAQGVTYALSSFMQCFAGAAAPPRCLVMDMAGGKSQVASVFTLLLLLLVLLFIAPVFQFLPNACLACIIIVALFPLIKQFSILPRLWRLSKTDLCIWIVTFLSSVILGITYSIGIGIVSAIFLSSIQSMFAKGYRYGTTNHVDLVAPLKTHILVSKRDDIAVFRYEQTLYYLTVKNFKEELFAATMDPVDPNEGTSGVTALRESIKEILNMSKMLSFQASGGRAQRRRHSYYIPDTISSKLEKIVLDCSPIGYIDILGITTLQSLLQEFEVVDIQLVLASCSPHLLRKLALAELIGEENGGFLIFPTVQDALAALTAAKQESAKTTRSTRL